MKAHNLLQTTSLLGLMIALLGLIGWIIAGLNGIVITIGLGLVLAVFARGPSTKMMFKAIGARKIEPEDAPGLYAILLELSRRAGLEHIPDVHLMDADMMMAFSAGHDEREAAIVLTGPLVQGLSAREIAGVLAHEISHIHCGDLVVMGMADFFTRITRTLCMLGIILILLNVPLAVSDSGHLSWFVLGVLVAAPMTNLLLQLTLSRAREYVADEGGVNLCGDPEALASALYKLELQQKGRWLSVFMPRQPGPEPSLLRSHPEIEERVQRILNLTPSQPPLSDDLIGIEHGFPPDWNGDFSLPVRWLMRWWR
jgi:heat shock protein HtpX